MRTAVCVAVAAALGAITSAEAVVLNPNGTGQVLIYPYYTVNAGFGTLLSLVNTTEDGKALKVHVREGYNGRDVVAFNLYLSPFDTWVAQIFDTSADGTGAAAMASNDNSCTVPQFSNRFGPTPGQGPAVAPFSTSGFTDANADGGPTTPGRTREGYVEIIEMGTVTNDQHGTLNAITHTSSGVPANCAQLVGAWSGGGYWATGNTNVDIAPPSGGLFGAESIINVGTGLMYTVDAAALDGFSSVAQHAIPGDAQPDLSSATKDANGIVSAFVPVGPGMVRADFTDSEDAISALFMADTLYNEYVVNPGVGAMTDWIVTFPTKRYYTDPALLGGDASGPARAPFDVRFSATSGGTSASPIGPRWVDREEASLTSQPCIFDPCPPFTGYNLYYSANAVAIGTDASALASNLRGDAVPTEDAGFVAGHLLVSLTIDAQAAPDDQHVLAATNGVAFKGLPAVGFAATNYVNGNVTPGVLANYSGAFAHRSTIDCGGGASPPPACVAGGVP